MVSLGSDATAPIDPHARLMPFVNSKVFATLFAQGMELVEETATYLDNGGRKAAKSLERNDAMTYAGVSMRLTTRLMQIASWLLVLRAVRDGEMSETEAGDAKYRIGNGDRSTRGETEIGGLPDTLRELISETDTLFARISRLDYDLFVALPEGGTPTGDAKDQQDALAKAFSLR